MNVRVRLFARARELAMRDTLDLELPAGATIADLCRQLVAVCPGLEPLLHISAFAVNDEFADDPQMPLPSSAEVAVLPPVSGGQNKRNVKS